MDKIIKEYIKYINIYKLLKYKILLKFQIILASRLSIFLEDEGSKSLWNVAVSSR
jgi:hypothetical protein